MINLKEDCKTNVVTMQHFRGEFLKLIRNQKRDKIRGKIKQFKEYTLINIYQVN